MHTISDIFYGNITPSDNLNAYSDKHYASFSKQVTELTQRLASQLSEEQMDLYNQIFDLHGRMNALLMELYYENGFRDGAGIMFDILFVEKEVNHDARQ